MYIVTSFFSLQRVVLHVHCHLFFMLHYTQLYFMYIVTSFLCFTTHSCTSCTLSPLLKWGEHLHEVQLCVVKHKKELTMCMKYSSVWWNIKREVTMYMKYSSSCTLPPLFYASLQSCTSSILSPLFHVSLHRAVLHVHYHLFLCSKALCVVKYENEVNIYMKYSSVWWNIRKRWQCAWSTALCSEILKERWQCTWSTALCRLYFMHIVPSLLCFTTYSCTSCTLSPLFYVSL
jgi:hypothetical protein